MKDQVKDLASKLLATIDRFEELMSEEERNESIHVILEALSTATALITVEKFSPCDREIFLGMFAAGAIRQLRHHQEIEG